MIRPDRIGYLEQELPPETARMTLYEFFCSVPEFFDRTPGELAQAARRLGLSSDVYYFHRTMGTLSGGECVKARLLALIIRQPDLLLLDEPSNDLDIPTLEWLERFIQESEAPVLYISHDETLLENTANVIVHLEQVHRKTIIRNGRIGEIYNVGGHNEMSNISIVRLICRELGKPESLITYVTDRKGHDRRYAIDPTKIHSELGWLPETKFEDGITRTIRWYLHNREWWEAILSGAYHGNTD